MPYFIRYSPAQGAKKSGVACCSTKGVHNHSHAFVRNRRLLRGDPTRTLGISRKFIADLRRRVRKLMSQVRDFMVDKDALGLFQRTTLLTLVGEREFEFTTDANKLSAFNNWFKQQVDSNVLSVPAGSDPSKPWTAQYVESAYRRGQQNAYLSTKEAKLAGSHVGDQTTEQFLRSAFLQPEVMSKVQFLATRSFETLKGVTASMSSDMNQILARGIASGDNPREIAREMQARLGSFTRTRAETIVRTETIHAHAEGQLDAFTKLGIEELGLQAEWSTAGDDRVCEECGAMEGQVFDIDTARNMIPLHPNCRCTWIPADKKGKGEEKKSEADIAAVIPPIRWSPEVTQGESEEFTKGFAFGRETFYHFTNKTSDARIRSDGFLVSDGIYGKGIYLTRDPTGASVGRSLGVEAKLNVVTRVTNPLEVRGFGGLSRWMDAKAPGSHEPLDALKKAGHDALVVKFKDKPDYVVVFDKKSLSVLK